MNEKEFNKNNNVDQFFKQTKTKKSKFQFLLAFFSGVGFITFLYILILSISGNLNFIDFNKLDKDIKTFISKDILKKDLDQQDKSDKDQTQDDSSQTNTISEDNTDIASNETIVRVVEKVSKGVVTIGIDVNSIQGRKYEYEYGLGGISGIEYIGSGFVVSDNIVVTNKHVVSDIAKYYVLDNEQERTEVVDIYRDPVYDIAFLKIKKKLPKLTLGDSDKIKVGQMVIAIGTPGGEFKNSVTHGIISGLDRDIETPEESINGVIQVDAAINPGNSGGPLVDMKGRVIGVNVATMIGTENIGFSIPINIVKDTLKNFFETGSFDRPFLGVAYFMIKKHVALYNDVPEGAYIERVLVGSSADEAGLKEGDIITEIDGQKVDSDHPLAQIINKHKIGDEITIKYFRVDDNKFYKTKVVLKKKETK